MHGKILILDGTSTNRIVLKVKLAASFYRVLQASTIAEAFAVIRDDVPDLIVTATSLPDGSIADLCQQLRNDQRTAALPVLAIGTNTDSLSRLEILRAGATDVMYRPLNEMLLLGRVRNMIRLHNELAEWQIRDETSCALGLAEAPAQFVRPAKISFVGVDPAPLKGWVRQTIPKLRGNFTVSQLKDALAGLHTGALPDAIVLSLPKKQSQQEEYLRLIPVIRTSPRTREIAILVVQDTPDPFVATSALDMGADDIMTTGFAADELAHRVQVLLKRKQQVAKVLQSVRTGLREVVNDPLTGLYNRRYAMPYLETQIEASWSTGLPLVAIIADLDHFKHINDAYGHASGDAVLVETAHRLRRAARKLDVIARLGGEEFLIVMPATDIATAEHIAGKICREIAEQPFQVPANGDPIHITISLGVAVLEPSKQPLGTSADTSQWLLDLADKELYRAKTRGRNCISLHRSEKRPAA
ncbi:diguanylate cyclase [Sulfitobacter donghicola]|uniref:diguanylate cyclase n=1 Tax=Sulfitobacter donghicola DSW-25 = KCTC 12864 = JCM 14565 TaxID=1300350 RepID=A0A073IFX5_9RHOB|nr:diguanylate cyclase [Sulfitobacter donghicola]KEJ89243.1 diguanylate cyclase [Sulfitobacter donghicola DSW-25 = KCTC 12864 = JCM 14565]KIN69038.1 Diguanylate cyclase response regulator [Sulfitobacter donghicola DSW-25 = KCTC 12864 = JCM 14565]